MRGQSCLKTAPHNRLNGYHAGKEREKLKLTPTSGFEQREVGNGIVQVNFHPREFKDVSALFSYSEM